MAERHGGGRSRTFWVDVVCPLCGETHWVTTGLQTEDGPDERMTVAAYYRGRKLPYAVKEVTTGTAMWCEKAQGYFTVDDTGGRRTTLAPEEWWLEKLWGPDWRVRLGAQGDE